MLETRIDFKNEAQCSHENRTNSLVRLPEGHRAARQHILTSSVDRQNLNLRRARGAPRTTHAFSKKFENHCHMIANYPVYYNFCRVYQRS
jgi:hypothetical protein